MFTKTARISIKTPLSIIPFITLLPTTLIGQSQATLVPDTTAAPIFSTVQAERGEKVFEKSCAQCHQPKQFTGPGFIDAWEGQPVEALFVLVRTTMPYDNPARLRRKAYADVLAYIFSLNGMPAGETDLPSSQRKLKKILIEGVPKSTSETRSKQ